MDKITRALYSTGCALPALQELFRLVASADEVRLLFNQKQWTDLLPAFVHAITESSASQIPLLVASILVHVLPDEDHEDFYATAALCRTEESSLRALQKCLCLCLQRSIHCCQLADVTLAAISLFLNTLSETQAQEYSQTLVPDTITIVQVHGLHADDLRSQKILVASCSIWGMALLIGSTKMVDEKDHHHQCCRVVQCLMQGVLVHADDTTAQTLLHQLMGPQGARELMEEGWFGSEPTCSAAA